MLPRTRGAAGSGRTQLSAKKPKARPELFYSYSVLLSARRSNPRSVRGWPLDPVDHQYIHFRLPRLKLHSPLFLDGGVDIDIRTPSGNVLKHDCHHRTQPLRCAVINPVKSTLVDHGAVREDRKRLRIERPRK